MTLVKSKAYAQYIQDVTYTHPLVQLNRFRNSSALTVHDYRNILKAVRYYYRIDPIVSTVVTRLAEIATTELRVSRKLLRGSDIKKEELALFRTVARIIQPHLFQIILSYLVDGMAVPQFELTKVMGNRSPGSPDILGRRRYLVPSLIWVRDSATIVLQSNIIGGYPAVFVQISQNDAQFIINKGVYPDGTKDEKTYQQLVTQFPEYVKRIKNGEMLFKLETPVILRNFLPSYVYPISYIEPALDALQRKHLMHRVDRSIAARTLEAFRHIKIGNDKYPADDEAIAATEQALQQSSEHVVFNLFTNHTVDISWIVPPFAELIDDKKYNSVIQDIFFAFGFPRILAIGETQRSNSADNQVASVGILATIRHIHADITKWVESVFVTVADANGIITVPTPIFAPVSTADVTQLLQYAATMLDRGVISKDLVARLYGSDYEQEAQQIELDTTLTPAPTLASS